VAKIGKNGPKVKIAEKSLKIGQFLPILATLYEFLKSRFEKNQSNQEPYLICLFSFSESTCSGVSKTENQFEVHAL
jgi:hypothetical protein